MCICAQQGQRGMWRCVPRCCPQPLGGGEAGQGQSSSGSAPGWVVTSPCSTLSPGALKWGGRAGVGALLMGFGGWVPECTIIAV